MSFYVYTTSDGLNFRHDATSVTVFDRSLNPLSPPFDTADDCDCAVSLSANLFAVGYLSGGDLSLFDLRTGEPKAVFPFQRMGPLATFDREGEHYFSKAATKRFFSIHPPQTLLISKVSAHSIE